MKKRALYLLLVLAAVFCGFAAGYLRAPSRTSGVHQVLYYVDPMHPAYRSQKPGIAPDCGMELVPVYAEDAGRALATSAPSTSSGATVDPATQQLYGIRREKVLMNSGQGSIRVFGRVVPDETRIYRVNVGTEGFVKETEDDAVGNFVKKDQHLAVVYSPEFLSVAGGYLSANERAPLTPSTNGNSSNLSKENTAPTQNAASAQARADRLRNLGMSDAQIDELAMTRKIPEDVYLVSPTDGFILERNISKGQRFERRSEFYKIADLRHVWILAEVFGKDARSFHPGSAVRITLPDTGETFSARVSTALPEVDPVSHILKLRLEAENPGFALRPDMFVDVDLPVSLPTGLTVSADALMDSGLSKRVFVEISEGHFEPRTVETGWRLDDRVQIVKGLKEGETVVSAGTFLVDSESRLQMAENSARPAESHAGLEDKPVSHPMN